MYPISVNASAGSGIDGNTRSENSGSITFGPFAVGSGATATAQTFDWKTVALILSGLALVAFLVRKLVK